MAVFEAAIRVTSIW